MSCEKTGNVLTKLIGMVAAMYIPAQTILPVVEKSMAEGPFIINSAWEKEAQQFQTQKELSRIMAHYAPWLAGETIELYTETIYLLSNQYELDPILITAMIWQESRFRHDVVSHKGARGLLQMMPRTARGLGIDPNDLFDPVINLHAGIKYLHLLQKKFGDLRLSVIAYNQGEGNVTRNRYRDDYYTAITTHYNKMQRVISGEEVI